MKITNENTTFEAMPLEQLERLVEGVQQGGKILEPKLIGEFVCVVTVTGKQAYGTCRGFLPLNHDINIKSSYLTLEHKPDEQTLVQYHLPPQLIATIERY